jgi:hypothetical protein
MPMHKSDAKVACGKKSGNTGRIPTTYSDHGWTSGLRCRGHSCFFCLFIGHVSIAPVYRCQTSIDYTPISASDLLEDCTEHIRWGLHLGLGNGRSPKFAYGSWGLHRSCHISDTSRIGETDKVRLWERKMGPRPFFNIKLCPEAERIMEIDRCPNKLVPIYGLCIATGW